jgi:peptidoglycan hydrolase-like protein with peptidoglycan-binding domain
MSLGRPRILPLAATIAFLLAASARAGDPDIERFNGEINAFIGQLWPSSIGAVRWIGSEAYEVRRDGDDLLAIIDNPRLSLDTQQASELTFDHLEIREIGSVEVDGDFSPAIAAAVARFQRENGLNVNGVVDAATRARLGELSGPMRQGGRN